MIMLEIIPRQANAPQQFHRLGIALAAWRESLPTGTLLQDDAEGLTSLFAGEMPPPVTVRHLNALDRLRRAHGFPSLSGAERKQALSDWLGLDAEPNQTPGGEVVKVMQALAATRGIFFGVQADRHETVAGLRAVLGADAELIERVKIDGQEM